jgi:ketosteroid isomerase-like protein
MGMKTSGSTKALFSVAAILVFAAATGCSTMPPPQLVQGEAAREQVAATERAFAKTMADRDLKAFGSFLSDDTVFFSSQKALRGKHAVLDFWARFYKEPQAPFSWEPAAVEVLDSGALARSTGPVYDPDGKLFACFNSIWRQESRGQWKIVFDHGMGPGECEKKK